MSEIDLQEDELNLLDNKLTELTSHLAGTPVSSAPQIEYVNADAQDTVLDVLVT